MLAVPNTKQLIEASSNVGAIGLGLIVGKVLQTTIMKNAEGKGFIPDSLMTNGAAAAILAVGSILVPNKFLSLVMAATAGYFLIRTVNKGTATLSGLGTLSGNFKDILTKYVPQLNGVEDEVEDMSGYQGYEGYGNVMEEPAYLAPAEMSMAGFNAAAVATLPTPASGNLFDKLA